MLTDIFLSIADAVISYVIEKLDPAEVIKTWLKRDPARLAFQKALAHAYTAFARQYPEYTASLFDKSFLAKEAVPEISKLLIRNQHPDPALLAKIWGKSLGFDEDSNFCKNATKPASDFIKWLEAELQSDSAFQALFDSKALDSLPKIENEIQKLTAEIKHGLDEALKSAGNYEKMLNIHGNIEGENVFIGDNNQLNISKIYNYYYSGDFTTLHDYYIPPTGVFERVRVEEFIGRDWLTAKVDDFLNDSNKKSGAFLLEGEAGVGKTSFMAHLVHERRYLHLFAEQVSGDANLQRALQSLGSQLVTRYQIDPYKGRDNLTQLSAFPDFLERLLRLAASGLAHGEKIVIVCDALDEAGTFPDGYVFGLPNTIPDGVYFILSKRPVEKKLPNIISQVEQLDAQSAGNLQDMDAYLHATAKRTAVSSQIRSKNYSEDFFVNTLKEKSLGVWMYLHYIIREIESGSRAPLDLENLPTGLVGYYADFWGDWRNGRKGRGEGKLKWDELYAPLLTILAATQQPVTVEQIKNWGNITATNKEIDRLLSEDWRSFITETKKEDENLFSPYHLSFRDFITGKVDFDKLTNEQKNLINDLAEGTFESHKQIVNFFEKECNGVWETLAKEEYSLLHLTAHLAKAKEYSKLINLLTEGEEKIKWAEVRYEKEETYAGYLSDLTHVWEYAKQTENVGLLIRCMLIENSIHSLVSNISPHLLAQLAETGIWSYPKCLAAIRQNTDSHNQANAIWLVLKNLPHKLIPEALNIASQIKDENYHAFLLADLAPHLNDELKQQALNMASQIKDESNRARALANIAPHLNDELKQQALNMASQIKDEYYRVNALADLAPHLNHEFKQQTLQQALNIASQIKDESDRARTLANIAPHLNDEFKQQTLQQALNMASQIKDESNRVRALADLAPHLNDELKQQTLQQVLNIASQIKDEYYRAFPLADLAPYLNDELKQQALNIASQIKDESNRVKALADLAPHLNDELKQQTLQQALNIASQIKDEYYRANALASLAPHLDKENKASVLLKLLFIYNNAYISKNIIETWHTINFEGLKEKIIPFVLLLAHKRRNHGIEAIAILLPALVYLYGKEITHEILRAIDDTARWWQ